MKIYVTAPIYYRKEWCQMFVEMISFLKKQNHTLFSDDILDTPYEEQISTDHEIQVNWFETWRGYVAKADIAIAEISYPGTVNVGFEVTSILDRGKPVIGLYRQGKDPVFTSGLHNSRFIKVKYTTTHSAIEGLKWALEEAKLMLSRRFTFFIPSEIDYFLEKLYVNEGTSRSEFIRSLIEKEMNKRKNKKK